MNGTAAVSGRLTQDASAQLAIALGEAVETLKKLRDRVIRVVDEDAMDAAILKEAMEEDDGTGWKSWKEVKKELKHDGLL
jgi:hypothetical protein